ncbi:MAG: CHAT domain-containing protein [bacterium]|nr:CHAT domain-containing protein [bacterium]
MRAPLSASVGWGGIFEWEPLPHSRLDVEGIAGLTIPEDASGDRDNGLRQAGEIFERVRLDADLVVLSACNSVRGEEQGGEGLIGLSRVFQYAGDPVKPLSRSTLK